MKMVFYISSLGKGGAERVISNLANYFSISNNVSIILERPVVNYPINSNIDIITMDKKKKKYNFLSKKIRYIKYFFKLKRIFKKEEPDVIISFLALPAFMSLMTKPKKSKIIVGIRNDPKTEYTTFLKKKLMLHLYPKADGFVFQTKEAQDYFKNIINCKQKIIYNAVSKDFINCKSSTKTENTIVAVGRLHWQKNYELLINAFKKISTNYKDYNLVIYGEGSERKKLEELIKKNNLEKKVLLPGNVDNVKEKIKNSSLYIMTSDFEGMPNSLIEAMVLGLPVISTDCPCGGPRELIKNNENGILVEIGNENELVSAICKILDNKEFSNQLRHEAKKIIDKVNPDYINNEWNNFIKDIYENCK